MSEEFGPNFITLTDEDGNDIELEYVDALELDGQTYMAFFPVVEDDADEEAAEEYGLVILKSVMENGEELYLTAPTLRLRLRDDPHIGRNTSVVEAVVRKLDDRIKPIVLNQVAADLTRTRPRVTRKQRRAVLNDRHATVIANHFATERTAVK